jgi:BCD family chlorophyll transporter-like MFS transporter
MSAERIRSVADLWQRVGPAFLPFADAATPDLPLSRLLRLSLFQLSIGLSTALMVGTLNRVMIVELNVAAWFVALMIAIPLLFAPFRAFVGFRSDTHRTALGWRRGPYFLQGTMAMFGGLAIMPFALLVLSGDGHGPVIVGQIGAGLAFVLLGAGIQVTQTAGLALAADLVPEENRPRVVALMYVTFLVGMLVSGLAFGWLLANFSPVRLIQVIQGAAVVVLTLNVAAIWKQEPRVRGLHLQPAPDRNFGRAWRRFAARPGAARFLVAIGLGSAAFSMQDIVLEPYGGAVLGMGVGATSTLTAIAALGALIAFALAAHWLGKGRDPHRVAAAGLVAGLPAFAALLLASPLGSPDLFRLGVALIGFGGGLFSVGTLTAAMLIEEGSGQGLALGAWGAVQASATGLAMAAGGVLRDVLTAQGKAGRLWAAFADPAAAYVSVYLVELLLLFAALAALGPLVSWQFHRDPGHRSGLAQLPG